jgi:hypothetical protein
LYLCGGQSDWAKVFAGIRDVKTQRNHRPISRRPPEKARFSKHLAEFWHDLQDEQHWKYESSSPVQILEQLDLDTWQQNHDELVRAQWFWNRRPRLLRAIVGATEIWECPPRPAQRFHHRESLNGFFATEAVIGAMNCGGGFLGMIE